MRACALLVVLVVLLCVGCGGEASKSRTAAKGVGAGGLVDVGGRRLYVACVGSGGPSVVLEAGLGRDSASWSSVLPEIGRTSRVCAYDRAGLGASDAVRGVRDSSDEVRDLERLLARGPIAPPYVLVGHSYGGFLARLFARAHPEQVAGVVFVDASGYDATRRQLAIWPRSQAPALRRDWAKPVQFGVDLKRSDALESELRRLGDTPVVAITGARTWTEFPGLPPRLGRAQQRLWRCVARRARRPVDRPHPRPCAPQSSLRDGRATRRGRRRVTAVVHAVRDKTQLPPCERVFTGPDVSCLG